MQIVIDIDEGTYEYWKEHSYEYVFAQAIKDGIILPKGHGKLIDADKIGLTDFECLLCDGDYKEALKMLDDKIKYAPTIIEADRSEKNEESKEKFGK